MVRVSRRRGFTLVELLVVIAIIGILIGLLVPAVGVVRGTAQRTACQSNMRQLGLAAMNFQNTYNRFPPSCQYGRGPTGTQLYEGWSWLVLMLPFIDMKPMYDTLPIRNGVPWLETDTARDRVKTARETRIPLFVCPSSKAQDYSGEVCKGWLRRASGNVKGTLTSYKGMGGTTKEATAFKLPGHGQTQPYPGSMPDGVMYPAAEGSRLADITDSQSQTIMAVETIEDKYARWMIGTEATLAGLPSHNDPAKASVTISYNSRFGYYVPQGFDGGFDNDSRISSSAKTYLDYDFKPQNNKYDPQNDIKYGPGSAHPLVTNHLFVDGTVRALRNDVDVAAYMFMITKSGSEQFGTAVSRLFGDQ
jgi:prepilin-type N-terminal cleavage/methylation domain-containing protein